MDIMKKTKKMLAREGYNSVKNLLKGEDGLDIMFTPEGQNEEAIKELENTYKSSIPFHDRFEKERQDEIEKAKKKEEANESEKKGWGERIKEKLNINDNKHEDILYKKNKDITEQEIKDASKYTWFESKDKNLNQKLNDKVSSWNDEIYGKEGQLDSTGRQVQPIAKFQPASSPVEARTKDGLSSGEGFEKISTAMSSKNADVSALQTGLNNSYEYTPTLKVDGDLGPKTTSRTKEAMFDFGVSDVVKKIFG